MPTGDFTDVAELPRHLTAIIFITIEDFPVKTGPQLGMYRFIQLCPYKPNVSQDVKTNARAASKSQMLQQACVGVHRLCQHQAVLHCMQSLEKNPKWQLHMPCCHVILPSLFHNHLRHQLCVLYSVMHVKYRHVQSMQAALLPLLYLQLDLL